ncbi:MAG: SDR family NAD(P)-dependent oxidoreductase, partial [Bacteroidota bacterium]
KNIKSTVLRMAGLAGGTRKPGRFLAGKKELKNGSAPINLVHQVDCVAIAAGVIARGLWNETYNVVADEHPTRAIFYTYQALKEDLEPPTFVKEDTEPNYKIVSNEKIKSALNYQLRHPDPMSF